MNYTKISTIGQLKEAGWKSKSIKEELRDNLIHNIKNDVDSFTGIHGYENTVIPE
jgi:magnesium chelatase subunit I